MIHPRETHPGEWKIYVDDSSNDKGCGAGVILETSEGISIEYSLKFNFMTSNNQAEYEACIAGIRVAKEMGASTIIVCSYPKLIVSQIKGEYQAKEPMMQKYLAKVRIC
jgi:ribonuclease HI